MSQLILKHPDFQPENVKFDTVEVHAGEPRDTYGSLIPPTSSHSSKISFTSPRLPIGN